MTYPEMKSIAEVLGADVEALKGQPHTRFANEQGSEVGSKGVVLRKDDAGNLVMGYIIHDDTPEDYWDGAEGLGEFKNFRSQDDQIEWMKEYQDDGKIALIVDRFEHGNVHYSISSTEVYPHRRWDVAPSAAFVPCDHIQEKYKSEIAAGMPESDALQNMIKDSKGILDEYSAWCNGETYCTVAETWEFDENSGALTFHDTEVVGGYIGMKVADEALEEMIPDKPEEEIALEM